ncbi:unnamed protein product [Rotaria sordida]|uniref:Uncharacterized protein n=1 Tax=Rotaria sordida TaxID=392033 RepID=A0A815P6I1_9BILA|nr:unnamed protein product [Rotaria sordida]CAF1444806.1 unnamed protein product [Rotaria sordida]
MYVPRYRLLKIYFHRSRLLKMLTILICLIILYHVYRSLFNSIKNQPLVINKETKSLISFDLNKDFEEISENLPPFYIRLPIFCFIIRKIW